MSLGDLLLLGGIAFLAVLLLSVFWVVRSGKARRSWRRGPPTWGGLYHHALAHKIAHPRRLRIDRENDLLSRAHALQQHEHLAERDPGDHWTHEPTEEKGPAV